jgi:hypothetical protein
VQRDPNGTTYNNYNVIAMSWKNWKGKKITAKAEEKLSQGLYQAMEAIGGVSDQQVPHDEGTLQESKTILVDPQNSLHVQIGYGGGGNSGFPRVPYAQKWHEVDANFQKGRKKNYLRDPVKSHGKKFVKKEIEKAMDRAL